MENCGVGYVAVLKSGGRKIYKGNFCWFVRTLEVSELIAAMNKVSVV